MATPDEVYDSMCELAQKLIDIMDDDSIVLNEDQFSELQRKIDKIHKHMEEYSKNFRT
jgi:dsDNA-binding SOS-regulon protein